MNKIYFIFLKHKIVSVLFLFSSLNCIVNAMMVPPKPITLNSKIEIKILENLLNDYLCVAFSEEAKNNIITTAEDILFNKIPIDKDINSDDLQKLTSTLESYFTYFMPSKYLTKKNFRNLTLKLHPDKIRLSSDNPIQKLNSLHEACDNEKTLEKDLLENRIKNIFFTENQNANTKISLKNILILQNNFKLYKKHDLNIKQILDDEVIKKRANNVRIFIQDNIANLKNKPIDWKSFRSHLYEFLYFYSHIKNDNIHTLNDLYIYNTEELEEIKNHITSYKFTIDAFEKNEHINKELQEIDITINLIDNFYKKFEKQAISLTTTRSQLLPHVKNYCTAIKNISDKWDPMQRYSPLNSDSIFRDRFDKKFDLSEVAGVLAQSATLAKQKSNPNYYKRKIHNEIISPTLQTLGYLEKTGSLKSRTLKNVQRNYNQLHNWLLHI